MVDPDKWESWAGLLADVCTFAGSLMLALDAPRRLRDWEEAQRVRQLKGKLPGVRITNAEEIQAQRSAFNGIWGTRLLATGFFFQLIVRFFAQ
jgi:hypothetical protein